METLKGMQLTFNVYAHDEAEVEQARLAVVRFINAHASQGRAVTAKKIADAVSKWDSNPIVKRKIIEYFK